MTTDDAKSADNVLALAEQALPSLADGVALPDAAADLPAHLTGPGELSDMLLATVFGPERSWEIACELVDDTLDRLRVCTLVQFLR